jgi:YVTN family beta-propeller protein
VGAAAGENRNLRVSPDGRLTFVPNTSTNTASVIDTETDTVIDTVTLASGGPAAKNLGIVHLPVGGAGNNH